MEFDRNDANPFRDIGAKPSCGFIPGRLYHIDAPTQNLLKTQLSYNGWTIFEGDYDGECDVYFHKGKPAVVFIETPDYLKTDEKRWEKIIDEDEVLCFLGETANNNTTLLMFLVRGKRMYTAAYDRVVGCLKELK